MRWNWTRLFWKVFSKRNLARQFPLLLRTPANQLLCDLAAKQLVELVRMEMEFGK